MSDEGCREAGPNPAQPYRLSALTEADLPRLALLEKKCFLSPWSSAAWSEGLAAPGAAGYVARPAGSDRLIGYVFFQVIIDEIHVLKLATAEQYRHCRIGTGLMQMVMTLAGRRRTARIILEVRQSNQPAISFYRKLGFRECGRRKDYYDIQEDAIIMDKTIKTAS